MRVFLQVVEERSVVTVLHALEDSKVQLEELLNRIEYSAQGVCLRIAGDVFDVAVGQQVEIKLGPHALERLGQMQCDPRPDFLPIMRRVQG